MAEFKFKNSTYKFTDPIRYFKANDPYYWEVDNIPLKQLHENTMWLKDQVSEIEAQNIPRSEFSELKPWVNGADRKARVNPGRYTARINDAYSPEPMAYLSLVAGQLLGEVDLYKIKTSQPTALGGTTTENNILATILSSFSTKVASQAKDMNGLMERAFTYPIRTEDSPSIYVSDSSPKSTLTAPGKGPFPLTEVIKWVKKDSNSDDATFVDGETWTNTFGFDKLSFLESALIKKWKGVTRTAIVDVPSELEITIPTFDANDFFYTDVDGNIITIPGVVQRIDLLFIYSKPIDASATVTGRYIGDTPRKITTPELGIVKGAGIGVDASIPVAGTGPGEGQTTPESALDADGNPMILPNINDALSTKNGFKGLPTEIHGSFPSPDDLMTIAPLLTENLETESYELVGQSILPVAYIIVRSTEDTLPKESVIDIRPFFRTTELAYNERAGIAAANPQISFANPVVGKALLDKVESGLKTYIDGKSDGGGYTPPSTTQTPRPVACGMLFGGAYYGPESVLIQHEMNKNDHGDLQQAWSVILDRYGLPSDLAVPLYPDWDWANHAFSLADPGKYINDYINVTMAFGEGWGNGLGEGPGAQYGSLNGTAGVAKFLSIPEQTRSTYNTHRLTTLNKVVANVPAGGNVLHYVSKTIKLDKTEFAPWVDDYDVQVQFWNCRPLSQGFALEDTTKNFGEMGRSSGVWIDKRSSEFTINIAMAGDDVYSAWADTGKGEEQYGAHPSQWDPTSSKGRDQASYSAFIVSTEELTHDVDTWNVNDNKSHRFAGQPMSAICSVPTVTFQVIGYPIGYGKQYNLSAANPTIQLK